MGVYRGLSGAMFLDCAVEAKAQRCGLQPPEARATDAVGFESRREATSQLGPERDLMLAEPGQSKKFRN
jgi:hypothetical protein